MIRVLVVDDERLIRERIAALVRSVAGFEVAGEAADGILAIEAIRALRPDLVLLDIEMPELDGLSVVAALDPPMPRVVFITAYDEHAIRAFELHAIDYIVKPIVVARFEAMLEHVRAQLNANETEQWLTRVAGLVEARNSAAPALERLTLRNGSRAIVTAVGDVICIDADDDGCRVSIPSGEYPVRARIGELAARLPSSSFARVHRSTIVNLDRVGEILPWAHGEYVLQMEGGRRIHVSRTHAEAVRQLLHNRV